jgi:hypothetical protein
VWSISRPIRSVVGGGVQTCASKNAGATAEGYRLLPTLAKELDPGDEHAGGHDRPGQPHHALRSILGPREHRHGEGCAEGGKDAEHGGNGRGGRSLVHALRRDRCVRGQQACPVKQLPGRHTINRMMARSISVRKIPPICNLLPSAASSAGGAPPSGGEPGGIDFSI